MSYQKLLISSFLLSGLLISSCNHRVLNNEPLALSEQRDEIRSLIRETADSGLAPGFITHIYKSNRLVFSDTYGFSSVNKGSLLKQDSLFRIYSMSKPVTTVAALILVERGLLSIDDEVSRYIPEFSDVKVFHGGDHRETMQTAALERPILVKDLMTHSAGFTYGLYPGNAVMEDYLYRGIPTGSGGDQLPLDGSEPVADLQEFAQRIAQVPLMHQPGDNWTYGNSTDVLGRVVEVASGERLAQFMHKEIFVPLGMKDTTFKVAAEDSDRLTDAYFARGQQEVPKGLFLTREDYWPDGSSLSIADHGKASVFASNRGIDFGGAGLVSTIQDYAAFSLMLLNDGRYEGGELLTPASVAMLQKNQLSDEAMQNSEYGENGLVFGFSVAIIDDNSKLPICLPKGSYFWGGAASTFFLIDPSNDIAILMFTQVFGNQLRPVWGELLKMMYGRGSNKGEPCTPLSV